MTAWPATVACAAAGHAQGLHHRSEAQAGEEEESMSAHKTARECISGPVIDGQESEYATMVDVRRTVSNIEAYAAAKVEEATKALTKERDDLRQMLADAERANVTFTPEWANVVWEPIVKLLAKHSKIPPGGSSYVEMLKRIISERDAARKENADLRQAVAVAEDLVRQASKREVMLSNENADLRARVEAVDETLFQASPEMELLYRERIDRALDLKRPFTPDAALAPKEENRG